MIALKSLRKNPRLVQVGDVVFFGDVEFDTETMRMCGRWLADQEWFRLYVGKIGVPEMPNGDGELLCSMAYLRIATDMYVRTGVRGISPKWISDAPRELVRYLEIYRVEQGLEFDQFAIVPQLPYAGIRYMVLDGGPISQIDRIFGVGRLRYIRQLAGLTDPAVGDGPLTVVPQPFRNTRFLHSLDTLAIAQLIGTNCGLSKADMLALSMVAYTHDVWTPAGGDGVKRIDAVGLDEDANYPIAFQLPGWKEFRDLYGLSEQVMADAVLGRGLLGKILDFADKIAYVSRDLDMFLRQNQNGGVFWQNFSRLHDRMASLLQANPYPGSVWECVRLHRGQLVVTDAERLADFLRIRALMFKALYFNPAARFAEMGYLTQIARILYEDGILTKDSLLEMCDNELFGIISQALGLPEYVVGEMTGNEDPRVEMFTTAEAALEFERRIARDFPGIMTCLDVHPNPSGSSSSKFNVLVRGKAIPFSDACPAEAWDIQQILQEPNPYRVFLYKLDELCRNPKMKQRIVAGRNKRIGLQ